MTTISSLRRCARIGTMHVTLSSSGFPCSQFTWRWPWLSGFVSVHPGDPYLRLGATFVALCQTLIVWGITRKLGQAFANQVWHADRCARHLAIQSLDEQNQYIALHGYLGFPRKPPGIAGVLLTVRLMFNVLYGTAAVAWLILFVYLAFRQFMPAPVL